jgi:hypothetical protein
VKRTATAEQACGDDADFYEHELMRLLLGKFRCGTSLYREKRVVDSGHTKA